MKNKNLISHTFTIKRNPFGKLVFISEKGDAYTGVRPVRAFPISAPDDGIGIINEKGEELVWIDRLTDLEHTFELLIKEELASLEFMPEISNIIEVSSFTCPCQWNVITLNGKTNFTLRGEEDIRRLSQFSLLITDKHGIQYLIRDLKKLDKNSRKLLDRFL